MDYLFDEIARHLHPVAGIAIDYLEPSDTRGMGPIRPIDPEVETYGLENACFEIVHGIRVYDGTTPELRESIRANTTPASEPIFGELTPSTLTAQGQLSGVTFNEEDIIDMMSPPTGNILHIGCNYGEIDNPDPPVPIGRKKAPATKSGKRRQKKSTRKVQGSGLYFSSQMTFQVYNPEIKKIYKIKLFRNGRLQAPGIRDHQMKDLIRPLWALTRYLREQFRDNEIRVSYLMSVMRNYTCRLSNTRHRVFLNNLENVFLAVHGHCMLGVTEIMDFAGGENLIRIAEIGNNCERYFGLMSKYERPVPWKPEKKVTIKVLRSGKISFDGCNSELDATEMYHWLQSVYIRYRNQIIYDPDAPESSSSESSGESIYDEDLSESSDGEQPQKFKKGDFQAISWPPGDEHMA